MTNKLLPVSSLIVVLLLVSVSKSETLGQTFDQLEREIFNRRTDMDIDVFNDFKQKYKCDNCEDETVEMLMNEFENYKRVWLNEMVDFIIKELDIDEEKAQFVRANPEKYFVDYETFKLLRFSWCMKLKIDFDWYWLYFFNCPLDSLIYKDLSIWMAYLLLKYFLSLIRSFTKSIIFHVNCTSKQMTLEQKKIVKIYLEKTNWNISSTYAIK